MSWCGTYHVILVLSVYPPHLRDPHVDACRSYYELLDGKKHDKAALDAARQAVAGRGDGRVSQADARNILATLLDGPVTQVIHGER